MALWSCSIEPNPTPAGKGPSFDISGAFDLPGGQTGNDQDAGLRDDATAGPDEGEPRPDMGPTPDGEEPAEGVGPTDGEGPDPPDLGPKPRHPDAPLHPNDSGPSIPDPGSVPPDLPSPPEDPGSPVPDPGPPVPDPGPPPPPPGLDLPGTVVPPIPIVPVTTSIPCVDATPSTGKGYGFTGLAITPESPKSSGKTYTFQCTMCPGGKSAIEGTYRYYEGEDPSQPNPSEYREVLYFYGNYFENVIEGVDSGDGKKKKVAVSGYYFCPQPADLPGFSMPGYWNTVLVYEAVDPIGAFGIVPGAMDLCFMGTSTAFGGSDILISCNQWWDPAGSVQGQYTYCRVGSSIGGVKCTHPWGL